jgi:hypothetical protein
VVAFLCTSVTGHSACAVPALAPNHSQMDSMSTWFKYAWFIIPKDA